MVNAIVGCGFDPATQTIFFTKDGKFLKRFILDVDGLYYISIGAIRNWHVRLNVGQTPFKYQVANKISLVSASTTVAEDILALEE